MNVESKSVTMKTSQGLLSEQACQEIDRWITKYPPEHKASAVLSALTIVQDENAGYLTEELMDAVADYLEMPKIAVYEVGTFYNMFDLEPVGKHKIDVCQSISCMLCGSQNLVAHLEKRLGIKLGQTTKDGKFTLRVVECLAACGRAPVMIIDKKYHDNLTLEEADKILDELES